MIRTNLKIGIFLVLLIAISLGCGKNKQDQKKSLSGLKLYGDADYSMWYGKISYKLHIVLKNVGETPLTYDLIRVDHVSSSQQHLYRQVSLPVKGTKTLEVGELDELNYEISGESAQLITDIPDNTLIIVDVFHSNQVIAAFFSFMPSLKRFGEIDRPAKLPFIEMTEQSKSD